MGGKSSPPPAPDYAAAAQATAQGNLANAKQAQLANMVNQVTPQGTVKYTQAPSGQWTQTVNLSPSQQALFNQNQAINQQLGNVAQQGVGYVQQALNKPLSFDQMQALQSPGQIQQQASDAAYQNAARYLDPQFQRQQQALESQLSNQGITRGSEAWNNAIQQQDMARQQAYEGARNQAYLQGLQGAGQTYQQGMGTRQQQISEAQALQQNPINMLNAVRTGQQMQVAQQPQVGVSSPANMATVAGPDLLGAASANAQYNQGLYNTGAASNSNMMGGLFQLGSAAVNKWSDRRLKKNIKRIGTHSLGIPLYAWDYLWGEHSTGVMADDVERVMPNAVTVAQNGFKMVNYAMLEA